MKYENEAFKVLHQSAKDMFNAGVISEDRMCEYDEMCLKNPKTKNKVHSVYAGDNSVNIKIAKTAAV